MRKAMKAARPHHTPVKPVPIKCAKITPGKNPTRTEEMVSVRRNAASPAPSKTPSKAKTTPPPITMATRIHHGWEMASSTSGEEVKMRGIIPAPAANTTAKRPEKIVEYNATLLPTLRACRAEPAPNAAPVNDCAAMANESKMRDMKFHSCIMIW